MSDEQRLSSGQRLFSALHALLKASRAVSVPLVIPAGVNQAPTGVFSSSIHQPPWGITTDTREKRYHFHPRTLDAIKDFRGQPVRDAQVDEVLHPSSPKSIDLSPIHAPQVHSPLTTITAKVSSLGEEEIKNRLSDQHNRVLQLTTHPPQSETRTFVDFPKTRLRTGLVFFCKIPVRHRPSNLHRIPESIQLEFWKLAVIKTRKEPRQLQLQDIFLGVPRPRITHLKYAFNPSRLTYRYNGFPIAPLTSGERTVDMAIFLDTDTRQIITVNK